MREIIRYGLVLMVLTGLLSAILSVVYGVTEPRRIEIAEREKRRAMEEVLPGAGYFVEKDWYFEGYESEEAEHPFGYAFTVSREGYSAAITTMVGAVPANDARSLRISGIRIISQEETPGLGARVEEVPAVRTLSDILLGRKVEAPEKEPEPWFQEQFRGKKADEITENEIEGITGATVTTEAVMDSVREGIRRMEEGIL